ncbi:MAG TPA: hypothetical protein PKC87_02655 [Candidatus Absconditabacterales bacterium]|nr:hypothetical protein [Candidatus Absconditabacterales bacterium]
MEITLNVKELIGLARLTVEQAEKFCTHANYKLSGSIFVLLDNQEFLGYTKSSVRFGTIIRITAKNQGTVTFTEKGERRSILLGDSILIVFKDDKPKYAIFNE